MSLHCVHIHNSVIALKEAISKSTVRTVFALVKRKQGQLYTFDPSTTFFVPCACFYICFQTLLQVNKLHTNRINDQLPTANAKVHIRESRLYSSHISGGLRSCRRQPTRHQEV